MKTRRLKMVRVSRYFWTAWMTQGYKNPGFEVVEGLPEGAEFVWAFHDVSSGHLFFVFRHDSFKPLSFGEAIPVMDVMLATPTENFLPEIGGMS